MDYKKTAPKLEEIIISLIENDLIHTRLVHILIRHSLIPANYILSLHKIIFWHIGFREYEITEEFIEWYFSLTEKASMLEEPVTKADYEFLAMEIYNQLKGKIQVL